MAFRAVTLDELMDAAASLVSEEGENPEYDRALAELIVRVYSGEGGMDRETIEGAIRYMHMVDDHG